jgi:Protein of unknown function (DUF3048) N-terminal domain/Protein of unknown function (DUF3048) C-terminal domain
MAKAVTERVPSPRRRVVAIAAAVLLAAAATLAMVVGRNGGDEAESPPPSPRDTPPPLVLPLLGTPGSAPRRAALAVKIDDTERGRPQSGLAEADVVFEEVVEGGLTRLLAVYQSQDPETVGPVRSARSTDLSILAELGRPLFAWSGANATFAAAVRAADIIDVGAGAAPEAYRRADDRPAPYNLYAAPGLLRQAAADDPAATSPPGPLFSYREAGVPLSGPGAETALGFRTTGAGTLATEIAWSWDAGGEEWVRDQDGATHVDSAGAQVGATNVIVRFTPYVDSGVRDSVGAVVPEAAAVGEGDAWLLSAGRAQPGRWHKPSADTVTTYTDTAGGPLRLAPGTTWVEVLPPGTGEIVRH